MGVQTTLPSVAGESPMHAAWYNQHIDQAPLVLGTGAHYIQGHSPAQVLNCVRDAFLFARRERRPVVIGVPLDLQQQILPAQPAYVPSTELMPDTGPMVPNPGYVARALERIKAVFTPDLIASRQHLGDPSRRPEY